MNLFPLWQFPDCMGLHSNYPAAGSGEASVSFGAGQQKGVCQGCTLLISCIQGHTYFVMLALLRSRFYTLSRNWEGGKKHRGRLRTFFSSSHNNQVLTDKGGCRARKALEATESTPLRNSHRRAEYSPKKKRNGFFFKSQKKMLSV